MAEKDVEIHTLLSEARVKSLEFARKENKLQPAIERARAWMKYYEKKSTKTEAKRDLAMLEYWRNELASWEAFQQLKTSIARYSRTHQKADLVKIRMAQAEYYERKAAISPPEEAERTKRKLTLLESLIEREKTPRYKHKPAAIIGYVILLFGAASLISSIPYASSILAFIGLGLTFWGALLLYIKPERYVKADLLNSTALSTLETINNLLTELNYKGKAIYLPPKHLKDLKSAKAFIPSKNETTIPHIEELHEETIFSINPEGIFITPPGLALTNLYEEKLGTSFTKQDIPYLPENLPKLFIEDLEIAEDLEINILNSVVHIKITGSVFQNLCKKTEKLSKINTSLGSPLHSSLAIALTRTTGKPIIIEKTQQSEDGKTIEAFYEIIEE